MDLSPTHLGGGLGGLLGRGLGAALEQSLDLHGFRWVGWRGAAVNEGWMWLAQRDRSDHSF